MKLNFRDLKQVKWELTVEPEDTVAHIKSLNAQERGYDDSVVQKLIYSGKILKDENKIGQYEIDSEKGFIVCMTSKKKAAKPKAEPVPAAADSTTAVPANAGPPPGPPPSTGASGAPATTGAPAASGTTPQSATASLPSVSDEAIASMMEMGYEKPLVMTALRMAYNNPDRAVEFLLNGQAQEVRERTSGFYDQSRERADDDKDGDAQDEPASELHDTTDVNLFDSAPQDPSAMPEMPDDIRQLRQLVRENPNIMEPLIEQLAEQNPMLAQAITQNLDEFLGGTGDEFAGGDEDYSETIEVTPEEDAAIGRLVELGFDRNLVIQAYFACEKNEEVTANYLFEHGDED